jgi:DNA mismatch endonuclease (patch repair protein)
MRFWLSAVGQATRDFRWLPQLGPCSQMHHPCFSANGTDEPEQPALLPDTANLLFGPRAARGCQCYRSSRAAILPTGQGSVCADRLSPSARSRLMSRVRSKDTGPEIAIRRLLTELGYRYRLQYKRVPGRPDIAFPGRRKVIWVHGCFWHQHPGCPRATLPKSRREFWIPKLEGNRRRDLALQAEVRKLGWDTLVAWECELRDRDQLARRLRKFLDVEE